MHIVSGVAKCIKKLKKAFTPKVGDNHREPLSPGPEVTENYNVLGLVGRGAFADVWKLEHKTTKAIVACKVIRIEDKSEAEMVTREVDILRMLSGKHAGVPEVYATYESQGRVEVVLDLCTEGDLHSFIQRNGALPEHQAKALFTQLAEALIFCHTSQDHQAFVHRDIKPRNVLLTCSKDLVMGAAGSAGKDKKQLSAKLADFGLAIPLEDLSKANGFMGTRLYSAPEVLYGREFGLEADVWGMGIVLYCMLTGSLPVMGSNWEYKERFWRDLVRSKVSLEEEKLSGVSVDAVDLLKKMLEPDATKRIRSSDLLEHPWVVKG